MARREKSVGGNEMFVTLLRVACEDARIKTQLTAILSQPSFHRVSMLNTFIRDMQTRNAG